MSMDRLARWIGQPMGRNVGVSGSVHGTCGWKCDVGARTGYSRILGRL